LNLEGVRVGLAAALQPQVVEDEARPQRQRAEHDHIGEEDDHGVEVRPAGLAEGQARVVVDHRRAQDEQQPQQGRHPGQHNADGGHRPAQGGGEGQLRVRSDQGQGLQEGEHPPHNQERPVGGNLPGQPGGAQVAEHVEDAIRIADMVEHGHHADHQDRAQGQQRPRAQQVGLPQAGLAHGVEVSHAQRQKGADRHLAQHVEDDE